MRIETSDPAYLVAHIEEALATDPRTNSLDVRVSVADRVICLAGAVPCERRRGALEQVTRELMPVGFSLLNRVVVETFAEPDDTEQVR